MEISSKKLKNRILKEFKKVAPPVIFDRAFKVISKKELQGIVELNSVSYMPFFKELFDCNRFSKKLISDISTWQVHKYAEDKSYMYPICIGFCLIEENEGYHSMVISLCDEGFVLVEPQTNEITDTFDSNKILFMDF